MYYTVYKTTNLVNNKVYIGAHKTKNLNDGYLGSGDEIQSAIKKYGRKSFEKEVLMTFNSVEEMYFHEGLIVTKQFIKQRDNYNSTVGGKIPPNRTGKPSPLKGRTTPLKNKTYEQIYGDKKASELRIKKSLATKGKQSGMKGKTATHGKSVYCFELDRTFRTCLEASKFVGLKTSRSIRWAVKRRTRSAAGYTWKYA